MKELLLITLLSTLAMSEVVKTEHDKYTNVCKSYIAQANAFKKTMGDDEISKTTLAFYKEKIKIHCGNIVLKEGFERESFIELMVKADVKDKKACKLAIAIASEYSKEAKQSELIISAHKENIADKCGSLVAAHVSNYCLHKEIR